MKLMKNLYSLIVFMIALFLALNMTIGITVVVPQLAQAGEKRPPAECPEPKSVTIDIDTSALLLLHWQNDLAKPGGKLSKPWLKRIQKENTIAHAKAALEAARKGGMFIIFSNLGFRPGYPEKRPLKYLKGFKRQIVEEEMLLMGTWGTANVDELKPLRKEPIIWSYSANTFEASALDMILRNRDIRNLFLSGISTNYVIESTVRVARDKGYKTHVLMDCCETYSQDAQCWTLSNVLGAMTVVTDSAHFIEALKKAR
jgi:ureidoacrylate peracid hydrolase